jgi:hypothetical protein
MKLPVLEEKEIRASQLFCAMASVEKHASSV